MAIAPVLRISLDIANMADVGYVGLYPLMYHTIQERSLTEVEKYFFVEFKQKVAYGNSKESSDVMACQNKAFHMSLSSFLFN